MHTSSGQKNPGDLPAAPVRASVAGSWGNASRSNILDGVEESF